MIRNVRIKANHCDITPAASCLVNGRSFRLSHDSLAVLQFVLVDSKRHMSECKRRRYSGPKRQKLNCLCAVKALLKKANDPRRI